MAKGPVPADGLKREDLIDAMGEPAGAATAIAIMTEADASLFI